MIIEGEYPGCDLDELRIEMEDDADRLIDNLVWKRIHLKKIFKERENGRINTHIPDRRADTRWSWNNISIVGDHSTSN